jgi:hypothetical protein
VCGGVWKYKREERRQRLPDSTYRITVNFEVAVNAEDIASIYIFGRDYDLPSSFNDAEILIPRQRDV